MYTAWTIGIVTSCLVLNTKWQGIKACKASLTGAEPNCLGVGLRVYGLKFYPKHGRLQSAL